MQYVLALDFDGVIHRYSRGDQGSVIYDTPTPGTREALQQYQRVFDVYIVSARAATQEGKDHIAAWMRHYDLPQFPITNMKPPGELLVSIDDRAWLFQGTFPTISKLLRFKPWWDTHDQ